MFRGNKNSNIADWSGLRIFLLITVVFWETGISMRQEATRRLDQIWVNWCEQRLVKRILSACQLERGDLLDVPCGYGRFAPLFARLGIRVVGVDLDPKMALLASGMQLGDSKERSMCASIFGLPFVVDSKYSS